MHLVTVLWSTDRQPGAVRAPGEVGNAVAVPLKSLVEFEHQGVGIKIPDDDGVVLGAGGKLEAVRREPAIPDFLAVIRQNLKRNQMYEVLTRTTSLEKRALCTQLNVMLNFYSKTKFFAVRLATSQYWIGLINYYAYSTAHSLSSVLQLITLATSEYSGFRSQDSNPE